MLGSEDRLSLTVEDLSRAGSEFARSVPACRIIQGRRQQGDMFRSPDGRRPDVLGLLSATTPTISPGARQWSIGAKG
jgi:hypothetical protein